MIEIKRKIEESVWNEPFKLGHFVVWKKGDRMKGGEE